MMSKNKKIVILETGSLISEDRNSIFHKIYRKTEKSRNKRLAEHVRKFARKGENTVFVALDTDAEKILSKNKIKFNRSKIYMEKEEIERTKERAMNFIENIRENKFFENLTIHKGISLWEIMRLEALTFFSDLFIAYETLESIIKKEKPEEIIVFNRISLHTDICKKISGERKIKMTVADKSMLSYGSRFFGKFMVKFFERYRKRFMFKKSTRKKLPMKKPTKKIILEYTPRYLPMHKPVVNNLSKDFSITWLEDRGIKSNNNPSLETYNTIDTSKEIRRSMKTLKEKWFKISRNSDFKKNIKYKKIEIFDLIKNELLFLFFVRFPKIIEYVNLMENAILVEKPKIIITEDDRSPFGRTLLFVAKKHGIKTLLIQHGAVFKYLYGKIASDKIAVFGEDVKNLLIDTGTPKTKIVITGQPRFDKLLNLYKKTSKKELYKRLKIVDKPVIFFAPTLTTEKKHDEMVRGLYETMKKFPEMQLVLKPHPGVPNEEIYEKMAKETDVQVKIIHENLYEALCCCELLITTYSTVGLEAMVVNRPVITINLEDHEDKMPYASSGAAIGVYRTEDIEGAIRKAIHDPKTKRRLAAKRKKFVYNNAYKMDGLAYKRVVRLIEKMLNERKN